MSPGRPLTAWLAQAKPWVFATYAGLVAFSTYFCMYAFRKPFAAASFAGSGHFFGTNIELKTAYVVSQIVGYTLSKYIGVKVCSELPSDKRGRALLVLVGVAQGALLLFALLPPSLRVFAMLLNGLPLGMVWGLVVGFLEGRRTSELMLAALSCSFIVASGVVKDVGRWLIGAWGVSETWMPFATGLLFVPAFIVSVWLLEQIPQPTAEDKAARTERVPMMAAKRHEFVRELLPGLAMLIVVYLFLTAFRDFRDNYGIEIFRELGYEKAPAIFTKTEVPVAIGVMACLAVLSLVQDNRRALAGTFALMFGGALLLGAGMLMLDLGWIGGAAFMLLAGLGSYLVYVPFNSVLFDRMMAYTKIHGTAVFAIYVADSLGYTGSIGLQLYKDLGRGGVTRFGFFRAFTYVSSALAIVLLALSAIYFLTWRPRKVSVTTDAAQPS